MIFIEDYKGQTINYDEDYDKFVCDISIEDKFKSTKRASLKDVRREIDQFIKLNLDFKPFKVITAEYSDINVLSIESLRTDGKLSGKRKGWNSFSHYGKKEAEKFYRYDADIEAEMLQAEDEFKKANQVLKSKIEALKNRLVKIDLSKYDLK